MKMKIDVAGFHHDYENRVASWDEDDKRIVYKSSSEQSDSKDEL